MWAKQNLIRGRNHSGDITWPTVASLDLLIAKINLKGYIVNSLQIQGEDMWSCSIADKDLRYSKFWSGYGTSAYMALRVAFKLKDPYTRGGNNGVKDVLHDKTQN